MEIKRDILWRVYLSFIGVVILSLLVLGRAFYIQHAEGAYWRGMSDSLHQRFVELDAERGTIYSDDGQMLSTSVPYFDIYMDMQADGLREKNGRRFRENIDSFSMALSRFFKNKSSREYKRELQAAYNKKNRYYLIRKGLTFEEYREFRDLPLVRLGRNRSGIIAETRSKRLNPFDLLARRTIGLSRDNAQNVGLERTYDSLLKGTTGKRLVRFIAGGAAVPVEGYQIDPENGKDIITTIDIRMQDIVEKALMKMLIRNESQYGSCIVMETRTGRIRAIANLGRMEDGSYSENFNYALQSTEPGSTIKLATLLASLDHGRVKMEDMVEIGGGSAYVGVRQVTDAERSPRSKLSVKDCFSHSSNVGMARIAYHSFAQQPDIYRKYLEKFHLDRRSGIDLLGEDAPRLPKLARNKEGLHAMLTASFGYAIQISPMQTLMLYNAVANDGKMMKPYLVSSIRSNGVTVREFNPVVLEERICRPEVIRAARESMEAVTAEGTAKHVFRDFPVKVAGKTGTAHVAGGNIKYHHGVYQASFAGYFPADNPEFTCIVVIRTKPHAREHYGGQLAAPVFREIAEKLHAQYIRSGSPLPFRFARDSSMTRLAGNTEEMKQVLLVMGWQQADSAMGNEWAECSLTSSHAVLRKNNTGGKTVPDVRNMTLRDALYLLESMNMKVVVRGSGRVVAQDIPPGTYINTKQSITLLLNH